MVTKLQTVAETARDLSREVKDSVVGLGYSAGRKIEQARDQTGGALHAVASSVRKSSAKIDDFATGAADRLDATASFVEDASFKSFFTGLRRFGQNHMTSTLLVAATVGFLAGAALNRPPRSNGRALETTV